MQIKSEFQPQQLMFENEHFVEGAAAWFQKFGGFDAATKKLKPLTIPGGNVAAECPEMYYVLDSITAAVEAGLLKRKKWSQQLFADESSMQVFLDDLAGYEECWRIGDRWHFALAAIADGNDEGFVTGAELADRLSEASTF